MNQPGPKAVPMGERIQPRPKRRKRRKFDHGEPIWRIDTRPMVFVFGIIALILLLPASAIRTHATVISLWDGTGDAWWVASAGEASTTPTDHHAVINRLTLNAFNQIVWNGEMIDVSTLLALLHEAKNITPEPIIEFEPTGDANYDMSARIIRILQSSGKSFRIAGMEQHCLFDKGTRRSVGTGETSLLLTTTIFYDPALGLPPNATKTLTTPCEQRYAIHRDSLVAGL